MRKHNGTPRKHNGTPRKENGTPGERTGAPHRHTADPGAHTPEGAALTEIVLPVFELNGEFLAAAETMTAPVGLTPAWWQVLGAALDAPRSVSAIARRVGLARQSVQRVADLLAEKGWAEYLPNPADRRAQLLSPTDKGRATVHRLAGAQRAWADAVGAEVGEAELRATLQVIRRITQASRHARGAGPDATSGNGPGQGTAVAAATTRGAADTVERDR